MIFLLDLNLQNTAKVVLNSEKTKLKYYKRSDSPQVKLAELFNPKVVNLYISLSVTLFDSDALSSASLTLFSLSSLNIGSSYTYAQTYSI